MRRRSENPIIHLRISFCGSRIRSWSSGMIESGTVWQGQKPQVNRINRRFAPFRAIIHCAATQCLTCHFERRSLRAEEAEGNSTGEQAGGNGVEAPLTISSRAKAAGTLTRTMLRAAFAPGNSQRFFVPQNDRFLDAAGPSNSTPAPAVSKCPLHFSPSSVLAS